MMNRIDEIKGKRVLPGDEICVIEEFLPGPGTFEFEGIVRSALVGTTYIDEVTRIVHVKPLKDLTRFPTKGSTVIGIVVLVRDEFAIVKVVGDVKGVNYSPAYTGILHISQASETHVKDLYEVIRVGDLIKAKVLNGEPPYNLTLREPRLGVILAFCGNCGSKLVKSGPTTLKCKVCGRVEKRKVSIDYGKLKGLII